MPALCYYPEQSDWGYDHCREQNFVHKDVLESKYVKLPMVQKIINNPGKLVCFMIGDYVFIDRQYELEVKIVKFLPQNCEYHDSMADYIVFIEILNWMLRFFAYYSPTMCN
jgi:hypothetical protein